ncbi:hypothetical protein ACFL1B_04150 [Nanoarchaeota archaeon]
MNNYPILHVTSGIIPDLTQGRVSDLALELLKKKPVNMAFVQIPTEEHLQERYEWLRVNLDKLQNNEQADEWQSYDKIGLVLGYNRHYGHIMISDPSSNRGLIQIVDKSLIFNPELPPMHIHRDVYMFQANPEHLVTVGFTDVVQEFLETGYELYQSKEITLLKVGDSIKHCKDLTPIGLDELGQ